MSTLAQPAPPRRTPAPIRRALFALAALFTIAAVGFGALSLLDLAARDTTTERASFDGISALVVSGDGDVRISGAAPGEPAEVVTRVTKGLWSPSHSETRNHDGTLELSASCPAHFGDSCRVSYEIRVPASTPVRVHADSGDIGVADLTTSKALVLETSAGDVTVAGAGTPSLRITTSAGDVEARDVAAPRVEARSSAGDVDVALREVPDSVLAGTSAGDVEVLVPDAVYRVDASSSAGDVEDNAIRNDPAATRTIKARSDAGDVRVAAVR